MPQVTILELARRLGLSKSSVSVALRGRPGVSDEMRARIMAEAERLGYKPNPVAAELMALVRGKKNPSGTQTVAFVDALLDANWIKDIPTFRDFLAGAREQAASFGYRVEIFRAHEKGMTAGRLQQILKTRGIRGIIMGPRDVEERAVAFEWDNFSTVIMGDQRFTSGLYRVCSHQTHDCTLALCKLAERGYRRIGLSLNTGNDPMRWHEYVLGVDSARRQLGSHISLFREVTVDWDPDNFYKWVETNRLDAVLGLHDQNYIALQKLHAATGVHIGYAGLDVSPESTLSGINQHSREIGRVGINLLRSLLHAGERGTTPVPRIVLVEGHWVDRETTRPPTS